MIYVTKGNQSFYTPVFFFKGALHLYKKLLKDGYQPYKPQESDFN